tara:strand:- start:565 stop:1137 length:573 start_codon:yes stop_codon:yes gene_type:complete
MYARGTKSQAMDDRTGKKVNYTDLRKEWTGHMVHKDEWEAKHPQLTPVAAIDAEALKTPRVDADNIPTTVKGSAMRGVVAYLQVSNNGGYVIAASKAVPSGVAITLSVGAESLSIDVNLSVTGVAGTGSVGNISSGIILAGVATTLSVGNEIPVSAVLETGVAITSAVGSVTIKEDFWGAAAWGSGTWGN